MSSAKSLPYPVLVVMLVIACVAARCVGEYNQGQERDARIEQHVDNRLTPLIPDCPGNRVYFAVSDGLVRYWCGR